MPRLYYQLVTLTSNNEEDTEALNTWAARGWAVDTLRDDVVLLRKPTTRTRPAIETRTGDLQCT